MIANDRRASASLRESHCLEQGAYNTGVAIAGKREGEIPNHMARLEKSLCYAEESFNELFNRLASVTRVPPPQVASDGKTPQGVHEVPQTSHGEHIAVNTRRAHALGDRIQDLLRHLEV